MLNDLCWDGDRFIRGFTEAGEVIGHHGAPAANLWLNPQSWAVISGLADADQAELAMDNIYARLNTDYGAILMDPPYHAHAFDGALAVIYNAGAKENADVAVIVLSRFSGEGWDRKPVLYQEPDYPWPNELEMPKRALSIFPRGDFYLTGAEQNMVRQVRTAFAQVVLVLNAGGVMDVSWFWEDEGIPSVLLAYQGGMEGGAAMAALLTGKANPCGRLPDTFAQDLSDYPSTAHFHDSHHYVEYTEDIYVGYRYFETLPGAAERVCYPFGYGLSYTTFSLETVCAGAENNISLWLALAVNIHRNPLCGRNFEYFSEDPLLTGKLAGAMVEGIQSQNIAATVKHFACNNKETNRKYSDSRLSQRALREIYLRAFEIIVREAQPWAIMSSYNVINGRRDLEICASRVLELILKVD